MRTPFATPEEGDYIISVGRGAVSVGQADYPRGLAFRTAVYHDDGLEGALRRAYRAIAEDMHRHKFYPNVLEALERGEYRHDRDAYKAIRRYELAVKKGKIAPPRSNPRRR